MAEEDQSERLRQERFAELLGAVDARLHSYIHLLVRDMTEADDIYQETCITLWRRLDDYDDSNPFIAWACGVARFVSLNHLRKRQRRRLIFSPEIDALLVGSLADMPTDDRESRLASLSLCVERLGEADRTLVRRRYGYDMATGQIAEELGRSVESVCNSLRRIRKVLLRCIRKRERMGGVT